MSATNWDEKKILPYTDKLLKMKMPIIPLKWAEETYGLKDLESGLIKISKKYNGAGLSANQVGMSFRYFVVTLNGIDQAYFNPEIIYQSKETCLIEEGCLSRPGLWIKIKRPTVVQVRYVNSDMQPQTAEVSGLLSRVIQHEYDHMEGKDFTQLAGYAKLQMALKKQKKVKQQLIDELARRKQIIVSKEQPANNPNPDSGLSGEAETEFVPVEK